MGAAVNGMATHAEITLAPRLRETLVLIAEGYTNSEIADRMLVGEETIKSRVKMLLRMFEARNRWHLVAIGIRSGVIS